MGRSFLTLCWRFTAQWRRISSLYVRLASKYPATMAMLIVQTQAGTERVSTSANTLPTPWDISRAQPNCYSAKFYPAKPISVQSLFTGIP
ncbi:hypothetical protein DPMN_060177 [Dreissena polymorpha]|uniref:Uncharacterized protein n=1 Tax=Dreissena polymorpha TaxID=45954 RepID=A0A9D4C5B6_DREPO|nr:hypothetical protein DPMN_060177 [Dreissena polymorpha]